MADVITAEEWYAELARLSQSENDEGMTSEEIRQLLGMGEKRTARLLKAGVKAGTIKVGQRKVEHDWDGRSRTYLVYMVVK